MKRLLFLISVFLMAPKILTAKINVLEPWLPGQDIAVGEQYSYEPEVSFIAGEYFYELPARFTYSASPDLEVGARWGIKMVREEAGINDLLLGLKYRIIEKTEHGPGIAGEAAVSLPTGDFRKNLGTGAASLLMHWVLEQNISPVNAYLGLGVQLNSENDDEVTYGNVFSYHAGAEYVYGEFYNFYGEIKGFNHAWTKISGTKTIEPYQELYFSPGMLFKWDDNIHFSSAFLIGLTEESNDLGFILSVKF